jgi:cobalt/nickel transport system ATP-binding protein
LSEPEIIFKNISYAYSKGNYALDNISFSVDKNEKLAVIGANGAGKSTLLLHFNGLLMQKGKVFIGGMEINKNNFREIRKKVGLLFQNPDDMLFCPTVFEDVAFGPLNLEIPESSVKERVYEALEFVNLRGYENLSPHHLSYGEKKRIALAAIFAMKPDILALDEPTTNLDPKSRKKLFEILKSFNGTLIISTHDMETVLALCEKTIVLKKGKIIAQGETIDILSNEKLMDESNLETPLSLKLKK